MRPEHLKLAGIVTMVCGALSPMVAGATNDDSPTTFAGRIVPLRSTTPDPAPDGIEADAQDGTAAPQGGAPDVAQTNDANTGPSVAESGRAAQGATPGIAYVARMLPWSGEAAGTVPESVRAPMAAMMPVASGAPVEPVQDVAPAALVVDDSLQGSDGLAVSAQHAASTSSDLAGSAHEPDVAADNETSKPVVAKTEDSDRAWSSPDLVAVSESRLDNMRGGFDLPSGLVVSFGISREAFVNGTLVMSTSFNIPNVAQMTPQQAQMVASANNGALIQNGLNNTVQPGGLPAVTGSVIQNTLSNQQIQALTTINTSVNSLSTFKAMNLSATLNNALLNVVRLR